MPKCPECDAPVKANAVSCEACGLGMDAPPPAARRAPPSNAATYSMIVGGIIIAATLLILLSSSMGSVKCGDCKGKGVTICVNCKDGVNKCDVCKGSGADPQTFSTCTRCSGRGTAAVCPKCKGTPKRSCVSCGGKGSVRTP